jgi:enoyl-CoA hydratase/carnithine racemase
VSDVVLVEDRGRVRVLTLNRPERKNAFNDDLYDGVAEALTAAADDPQVAVVVITGAEGAFSAGQDLGAMAEPHVDADGSPRGFFPFVDVLATFPKPLLGAVNGVAVGVGVTMLLHCDIVMAADTARFRTPFVSLGIVTEAGSSLLFPALLGWQETARLLFTCEFVDAAEAQRIGLVWKTFPADSLTDEVLALADQIAAMPASILVTNKQLLIDARIDALRAAVEREKKALAAVGGGPAVQEAVRAFMEKRAPDFSNL